MVSDEELTNRIGQRLRQERQRRQWSLSQLAERTDVLSKSRISNDEQGIRRPGIETATILAEAFGDGVSPTWLLCVDEAPPPLSDEEIALLQLYRDRDACGQRLIVAITRAVCEARPAE